VVALADSLPISKLMAKVEGEFVQQRMRAARETTAPSKHKIRCRSIFLQEHFEILNHKSLVREFFTDFMEVSVVAQKM